MGGGLSFSPGAIRIYITCFKKRGCTACWNQAELSDGQSDAFLYRELWDFVLTVTLVTKHCRVAAWVTRPTGLSNPFQKMQNVAQASSLDCPLWLWQRPWSAWTLCSSLAVTFGWLGFTLGFFFYEIWRILGFIKKNILAQNETLILISFTKKKNVQAFKGWLSFFFHGHVSPIIIVGCLIWWKKFILLSPPKSRAQVARRSTRWLTDKTFVFFHSLWEQNEWTLLREERERRLCKC